MAGLDPAIHLSSKELFNYPLARTMDGRVEPGHDEPLNQSASTSLEL
jgi:hypothetical protein